MKTLNYQLHIENYRRYLRLLNYAESTVYNDPKKIKYFLEYLENRQITEIEEIKNRHIQNYVKELRTRPNMRKNGALSKNYIQNNVNALKRFSKYLQKTQYKNLNINIKSGKIETEKITLTKAEISALYKATNYPADNEINTILNIRDRAMLGIYYGCGLRRNEGIQLDTEDILTEKSLIFVRKAKGNRQRYVPVSKKVMQDLKNYMFTARNYLTNNINEKAFFLSSAGKRLTGQSMIMRLKKLLQKADIKKDAGLHTLRHSIATHFLKSGMKIENLSDFLGHASLESTQIYTHLCD